MAHRPPPRLRTAALVCTVLFIVCAQGVPVPRGSAGPASPGAGAARTAVASDGNGGGAQRPSAEGSSAPSMPGADPSSEPFIDAGAMASRGPWAGVTSPITSSHSQAEPRARSGGIAPLPSLPIPAAPNGTVTGNVKDRASGRAIVQAHVVMTSVSGGCGGMPCPSGTTDAGGAFSLSAPLGVYTLTVSAANYSENATTVAVISGLTVSVGTIRLVRDGVVAGLLEGSDPAHEPLAGFGVSATSRNGLLVGDLGATASDGSFRVNVPPVADRVDFLPAATAPYEANHTFVDPSPGQTLDLGVVYLLPATELNLSLIDRVTHQPLGPSALTKAYACEQRTSACPISLGGGGGRYATAWAVPGPTVLHVLVVGYVVNVTPVGVIPVEPFGTAIHLTVNVTPLGVIRFSADVTGGDPTVGGVNISYDQWWRYVAPGSSNVTGAVVCSLDGVSVAIVTQSGIVPDPCVPNVLSHIAGTSTLLGPPLRDWVGIGSFRGVSPMFENMTWVNLTPDRLTAIGSLNFTAGAYLTGEVYIQGTTRPPTTFNVQACSTDERQICGPPESYDGTTTHPAENVSVTGCHTSPASFCAPAPPGPVVLTVSGSVTGLANQTWAYVPSRCCTASPHALSLWNSTDPHVSSVNLTTAIGALSGRVKSAGGEVAPPLSFVEVETCLVSANPSPPCDQTIATNGSFTLSAPLGWNHVTAFANSYAPNSTWVYVTGTNTTGTIVLTPHAVISGRVVDPNGTGVLGANVQVCPIAPAIVSRPNCAPLDTQGTGSGGLYSGEVVGGTFPAATYQVLATASGYSGNWTWVNATPGALVFAPRITLEPVGNGTLPGPISAGPRPSNGSLSTWVDGRVRDAGTRGAIPGASLTACSLATPPACVQFSDSTSTDGSFNASLGLDSYALNVSQLGYVPETVYLNATGLAPVHLGDLNLTPYPWVDGRVAIAPWASLTLSYGLGPGAAGVDICNGRATVCAEAGILSTAGFFNVSAPVGLFDGLWINATGGSPNDGFTRAAAQGGGPGGFVSVVIPVNVSAQGATVGATPSSVPGLEIYSSLSGALYDESTSNAALHRPGVPARWASVAVTGPDRGANLSLYLSGGGRYTAFVPGGEKVTVVGSGNAFLAVNATALSVPASPGSVGVPAFELPHYGWVRVEVRSIPGAPIPFATASASLPDPGNRTTIVSGGVADGHGYLNLSAPPGSGVTVRATAPGFGNASSLVAVLSSASSNVTLPGLPKAVTELVIRSASVNTLLGPPRVAVRDNVSGLPIAGVAVAVTDGVGNLVDLPTSTNGLGQFLLAASVEPSETLGFVRDGYVTNFSFIPTSAPAVITVASENLTGYGVVAGRIVGLPSGRAIPGANVSACPITGAQICTTVETNGAGQFWVARPPGGYLLSVAAPLYDTNVTVGTTVCADCFRWLGDVGLYADAIVTGTVVGEPLRLPVAGANVTLCPTNGSFFLPCLFPTPTDAQGGFRIVAPQGAYAFTASAPSYGPVYLPLQLSVGEALDMGLIALPADGAVTGTVLRADTGSFLGNASVVACPIGGGRCAPTARTDALGTYRVANVTPGANLLTVTAVGYGPGYLPISVPSGGTALALPVYLWPLNVTPHYPVYGRVVWNATGAAVPGARVSASLLGAGVVASMLTPSNGSFRFVLGVGSYDLEATAAGARPVEVARSVDSAAVGPLSFRLDAITYALHGIVTGAGPGVALPGVRVSVDPTRATLTASDGSYSLDLPNGTFHVVATPVGGPQAAEFGSATAAVLLRGAPAQENLVLPERTEPVQVTALDTVTGRPVVGAAASVAGPDDFGATHSARAASDANGSVRFALPPGSYTVWVNASGYVTAQQAFQVGGAGASLVIALAPVLPSSPPAPLGPLLIPIAAIDGAAILIAVLAFWAIRRHRARRPPAQPGPAPSPAEPEVAAPGSWAGPRGPPP